MYMSFRLVPKSVTLNDLERRNGRYIVFISLKFGKPVFKHITASICGVIYAISPENRSDLHEDFIIHAYLDKEVFTEFWKTCGSEPVSLAEVSALFDCSRFYLYLYLHLYTKCSQVESIVYL